MTHENAKTFKQQLGTNKKRKRRVYESLVSASCKNLLFYHLRSSLILNQAFTGLEIDQKPTGAELVCHGFIDAILTVGCKSYRWYFQ